MAIAMPREITTLLFSQQQPTILDICAGDINIDPAYQRLLNQERALAMAETFDWNLVMTLGVNERHPGSYWCFDGQHRLYAIQLAFGSDRLVTCYVTHGLSQEQEAALFHSLATKRKSLTPAERFKAKLVAGDAKTHEVNDIVERCGFFVAYYSNVTSPRAIMAVNSLEEIHRKYQSGMLENTLRVIAEAWAHMEIVNGQLLLAITSVLYIGSQEPTFSRSRLVSVLRAKSPSGWIDAAKGLQRLMGGAASSWVAPAIIRDYNYKLNKAKHLPFTSTKVLTGFTADAVQEAGDD